MHFYRGRCKAVHEKANPYLQIDGLTRVYSKKHFPSVIGGSEGCQTEEAKRTRKERNYEKEGARDCRVGREGTSWAPRGTREGN